MSSTKTWLEDVEEYIEMGYEFNKIAEMLHISIEEVEAVRDNKLKREMLYNGN